MAATTIDEIQVLIRAQADNFQSQINKVNKSLDNLQGHATSGSSKISAAAVAAGGLITAAFTKAFSAVASSMDSAISRLDTLNNFPRVMSNLGISTSDAQGAINYLSEKLSGLPTTLDDAAMAVQRFTAANNDIKGSTQAYLAVNNALLAGGASMDVQSAAMEQLTQAYSKGKPEAEEWRSMLTAMPAQMNQIAQAMGYSSAAIGGDLQTAMTEGEVSMNDFMNTAIKLNQQGYSGFSSFEEQARAATGGVATSITNMQTAISRGIANILGVLGQANIAGFFNKIASVIDTVSTYIGAFVKLIKEAVAWVQALFGGGSGSTKDIVKETSGASSNVGSVASGAQDAAGGLNDAAGAAKKLNKQLAGFDEMNVLSDKSSASSGGGGNSGSGGVGSLDTGNFEWDIDADTSKIDELAETLKKKLLSVFDFDWDAIGASFVRLWDDIKAAAEPIGNIIGDVWNDYLKPLVEWTGNSLLPAALNAIGGAIQFVGAVLGSVWSSYLKPFIDAFLVPIAQWTGGVIVNVLNEIGDGLRSIAQNEDAVKAVATGVTALGAAIGAAKVASFFSEFRKGVDVFKAASSGGLNVVESLSGVSSATTGLTSKIASLLAGGLNPMSGVLNLVKTGFSALWGVISAHPIAALVTVVAGLLLTNEDLRKSLGDLISAVLEPLGSILNSLMSAIEPILQTVGSLINILGTLIGAALTPIAELLSVVLNALTPLIAGFIEFATPLGWISKALEALQPILNGVADAVSWVSDAISGAVGWFSKLFGSSEKMEASQEDLKEMNDKLTESAEKYNDALERQKNAQEEAAGVAVGLLDAQDKLIEKNNALAEKASEIGVSVDVNSESYKNLATNLAAVGTNAERAQLINETYGTNLSENDPLVQQFARSVLEQADATQGVADAQQRVTENQQAGAETQQQMTQYINDQIQALKDAGLSSDQMNEKLKQLTEDGSANSLALKDEIIKNAGEFGLKWDETTQSMADNSKQSRKDNDASWSDVGKWFGDKFNEAKTNMSNAFSGVGQWASDRWNDIKNGFNGAKDWFKSTFESAKNGISEGLGNIGQWASDRWNDIKNAFNGAKDSFVNVGKNILDGLGQGIGNMGQWLKDKFNGAVDAIKNFLGIHSPSKLFREIGDYMGSGLSIGFDRKVGNLVTSAEDVAAKIDDAMSLPSVSGFVSDGSMDIGTTLATDVADAMQSTPIQLTVNLGNEKLIDQTVQGINDRSFLDNRTVINI